MKTNLSTHQKTTRLVLLGLLTSIMLVLSYTPLGYLKTAGVEITFNMIPVAIAAIILGPVGGGIIGGVFGITSFLQCVGVGGLSAFGATLFGINPIFTFILCFVTRVLAGVIVGYTCKLTAKSMKNLSPVRCAIAGFLAAFINTVFFVATLLLLFGGDPYIKDMIAGRNILIFACVFVGINAVFEIIASTVVTTAVGVPLLKSKIFK